MNKAKISEIFRTQLAIDYNCTPEDFLEHKVLVTKREAVKGRRQYKDEIPSFSLISTGRTMVIMTDEKYYDWAVQEFSDVKPQWVFEFPNLAKIERKLNENGEHIADAHQFYLPIAGNFTSQARRDIQIKFYAEEDILQFKDNKEYNEAFAFNTMNPDVLGVSASSNGKILAMAGASRDSDNMWQIGINVLGHSEGRGLGAYATQVIKDKILALGKLPFYGTAVSHFASLNVARKAGFYPAWAELYSEKNT